MKITALAWLAIVVGIVLGAVAIGLFAPPAAVVGYTAGVFVVVGVLALLGTAPPEQTEG